jgi:glycosyltransferase involved in cell wall biosynthesis
MRIAIASNVPRDERLGSAKVPLREAVELRRLGVDVLEMFEDALPPPRNGRTGQLSAPGRMAAALFRTASRCDVVDIAGFDGWAYARAARLLRPRQAVVVRSNGLWVRALAAELSPTQRRSLVSAAFQRGVYCRWERMSIGSAHAVRVMSSPDRDQIIDLRWKRPESVFVVHPGVDDVFASDARTRLRGRKGIAFVGSWIFRKGTAVVVDALSAVMRERPDIPVAVLGAGRPPDAVRQGFSADVRSRVEVLPVAAPADLARRMAEFAIMFFPTRYEGFGMVVAEAMRAGLAVVTTRTGAGVDLIDDGTTGLAIPVDDPGAAARALRRLLEDDDLRCEIAAAGMARASLQTWERAAHELVAVYEAAIRGTARGPS